MHQKMQTEIDKGESQSERGSVSALSTAKLEDRTVQEGMGGITGVCNYTESV